MQDRRSIAYGLNRLGQTSVKLSFSRRCGIDQTLCCRVSMAQAVIAHSCAAEGNT